MSVLNVKAPSRGLLRDRLFEALKQADQLERSILDNWAKHYVQEFFSPSAISKNPITLGAVSKKCNHTASTF